MPYVTQVKREAFTSSVNKLMDTLAVNYYAVGDINYIITRLMLAFIETHGKKYETYNAAIGVLECAKQELYRKSVSAYEDHKAIQNGDVFYE